MITDNEDGRESLSILLDLLSHDINNHIHGSMGYLDLLKQTIPDDRMLNRFLENSMSEIKAITPFVDNVRLLVNILNEPYKGEEVDLYTTLITAKEAAEYQVGKQLVLDADLGEEEVTLKADRFLQDVFLQILSNSLKFDRSPEVHVEVAFHRKDGKGVLSFTDHGEGIPDDMKEKVFRRFNRIMNEGDIKGKGMGLSVVKKVMERYGGKDVGDFG